MKQARLAGVRTIGVMLAGLAIVSAVRATEMKPPLLQIGRMDSVAVDGRIGDGEWAGGVEVGALVSADGLPSDAGTRVRLGWDDDGLVLLWEMSGDPSFKRRSRDGDIWRDDAVEVRLRSSGDASVYRFAVNAGGTIYDAHASDTSWDAPWRALVLRGTDGWRVEMRIPFAAFGGSPGGTPEANLLVHCAETDTPIAFWTPLGDGGEDRFGFLRLARERAPVTLDEVRLEGDFATIVPAFTGPATLRAALFDQGEEVQAMECAEARPLAIEMPHPGQFRLRIAGTGADGELVLQRELPVERVPPLRLSVQKRLLGDREIDVRIDGEGLNAGADIYRISATGVPSVEVTPGADRVASATVDLTGREAGEVTISVVAIAGGAEIAKASESFVLPERPWWAESKRGMHGRLMEPWTPVEVRGAKVRCWDRVYALGEQFLPVSITSGGDELLAGPVALRAQVDGSMRAWEDATLRWLETTETHAVAALTAMSPLAEARVRATFEFDGLMQFEVSINPLGQRSLSEVRLEIPVGREFATHLQVADGTSEGVSGTPVGRDEHTRGFAPMVWLTGGERGVQWLCESNAGWSLQDPETALKVTRGRDQTRLTVTMVDRELAPGERFETSFALQATPVRPVPEGGAGGQTARLHELPMAGGACDADVPVLLHQAGVRTVVLEDEDYQPRPGGLGASADATLSDFARLCHEAGLRLLLVLDDDLSRDPIWEAFGDEVAAVGAGGGVARPCPGSAWANYVVEAVAYAMEQYDADGIHLRGGVSPRLCALGLHGDGTGEAWALTGARELMKRLRTVVHGDEREGTLTVELCGGTPASAVGFADGLVIGASDADRVGRTIDEFVARGGTGALGTDVEVALPATDDLTALHGGIGLGLLHAAGLRPAAGGMGLAMVAEVWAAQERLGLASASWRPWYTERPMVTTDAAGVLVSTWWRDGEVLAVVANRSEGEPVVELSLRRDALDVGRWWLARDVLAGERVPQMGEVLRMRMESAQTSLVHVRTRHEKDVEIDE